MEGVDKMKFIEEADFAPSKFSLPEQVASKEFCKMLVREELCQFTCWITE